MSFFWILFIKRSLCMLEVQILLPAAYQRDGVEIKQSSRGINEERGPPDDRSKSILTAPRARFQTSDNKHNCQVAFHVVQRNPELTAPKPRDSVVTRPRPSYNLSYSWVKRPKIM